MQFNKDIEAGTLLKGKKQSETEQQPGSLGTTSREVLQSTGHRYDQKLLELVEEVNPERTLGYKIIEDSDRPNKQTKSSVPTDCSSSSGRNTQKNCSVKTRLCPTSTFFEEHLKEARKCKASLDYHWLAYISKGTQPTNYAEQINAIQALNNRE